MALSKQDQAFYEEKLNYKSVGYLFGATCLLGSVMFPAVSYFSIGLPMTANEIYDMAIEGFLLGTVVAFFMYMAFKFLLSMGWLPARR